MKKKEFCQTTGTHYEPKFTVNQPEKLTVPLEFFKGKDIYIEKPKEPEKIAPKSSCI